MTGRSRTQVAYQVLTVVAALTSAGIWVLMVVDEDRSVGAASLEMVVKFTNLTVLLVAAASAWIALDGRSSAARSVAHLTVVVMALVTAVVNATLLDPALPSGWWGVVDLFQHYLIPLAVVALWAAIGPPFDLSQRRLGWILAVPFVWLVSVLVRGAVTDTYPYDFVDVGLNGWSGVLPMIVAILLAMLGTGLAFTWLDRRRVRDSIAR